MFKLKKIVILAGLILTQAQTYTISIENQEKAKKATMGIIHAISSFGFGIISYQVLKSNNWQDQVGCVGFGVLALEFANKSFVNLKEAFSKKASKTDRRTGLVIPQLLGR